MLFHPAMAKGHLLEESHQAGCISHVVFMVGMSTLNNPLPKQRLHSSSGFCYGGDCFHPWVTPSSHNRLSTLESDLSHSLEHITKKANSKHILLLNSWPPSAPDLLDRPWQHGLACFPSASLLAKVPPWCVHSLPGWPKAALQHRAGLASPFKGRVRHEPCSSALCS